MLKSKYVNIHVILYISYPFHISIIEKVFDLLPRRIGAPVPRTKFHLRGYIYMFACAISQNAN